MHVKSDFRPFYNFLEVLENDVNRVKKLSSNIFGLSKWTNPL